MQTSSEALRKVLAKMRDCSHIPDPLVEFNIEDIRLFVGHCTDIIEKLDEIMIGQNDVSSFKTEIILLWKCCEAWEESIVPISKRLIFGAYIRYLVVCSHLEDYIVENGLGIKIHFAPNSPNAN